MVKNSCEVSAFLTQVKKSKTHTIQVPGSQQIYRIHRSRYLLNAPLDVSPAFPECTPPSLKQLKQPLVTVCFASTGLPAQTTAFSSSSWVCVYEALSKCRCGLIPCFSNGSAMGKQFHPQMSHKHYKMPRYYCVSACKCLQGKLHSHTVRAIRDLGVLGFVFRCC